MKFTNSPLLRWHADRWFGVSTPSYEASLLADLKALPVRAYDAGPPKTWWFPGAQLPLVEALVQPYFPSDFVPLARAAPTQSSVRDERLERLKASGDVIRRMKNVGDPYATLCVTRDAPDSVLVAAIGALLREEFGGDYEKEQELLEAHAAIRRDRGL